MTQRSDHDRTRRRHVFTVHQITLTDAEVAIINREGHDAVPKQIARLDVSTPGGNPGEAAGLAWLAGHYNEVAKIVASGLEDVFEIGNCGPDVFSIGNGHGPQTSIARSAPMHSVSVGDIVEGPGNELNVVASFGFKPVLRAV